MSTTGAAANVEKSTLAVDVRACAPSGCRNVVVDLFSPSGGGQPSTLICCVPGGGMSRAYFDLAVPGQPDEYSMARFLAGRGHWVMTVDPPAVGESDQPEDGYALSPRAVAEVLDAAVSQVRREAFGEPSGSRPLVVGVGHSAGGLLVACQQARHATFDALGLLGFSASGLPEVLTSEEAALIGHPEALEAALPGLVRARFGEPLPNLHGADSEFFGAEGYSAEVAAAAADAASRLLGLVGLMALVPGSVQPQLDRIDVPVVVALGERDIAGSVAALPEQLPNCDDLTLITLRGVGHNHNLSDSRFDLWDRLERWVRSIGHPASVVPRETYGH